MSWESNNSASEGDHQGSSRVMQESQAAMRKLHRALETNSPQALNQRDHDDVRRREWKNRRCHNG
jgi:hypothetical protein